MHGKMQLLQSWLQEFDPHTIQVVVVHDVQDIETGKELSSIISDLQDKKIHLIEGKYGSPGLARNAGIGSATSDWLVFWDSDDSPQLDAFIDMVSRAENAGCEIAVGGYEVVDRSATQSQNSIFTFPSLGDWGSNLPINPGIWRWAFRIELFQKLRFEQFSMGEDQALLVCLEPLSRKLFIYEKCVYRYSTGLPNQLTAMKNKVDEISETIEFLFQRIKERVHKADYFETTILIRQCITAIKKGKFGTKAHGFIVLFCTLILFSIINIKTLIKSMKCIYLYAYKKKNETHFSEVFMLGGLGNQLFQLAAGLGLSRDADLFLNYSAHSEGLMGFDSLQEFTLPESVFVDTRFVYSFIEKKFINLGVRFSASVEHSWLKRKINSLVITCIERIMGAIWPGKWRINRGVGFDATQEKVQANYRLGYFQTFTYLEKSKVHEAMSSLSLRSPSEVFLLSQEDLKKNDSLVVHIRLGDYKEEGALGVPSLKYFQNSILSLWETGDYTRICLFTNEFDLAIGYIPVSLKDKLWIPSDKLVSSSETLELMRYGKGYVLSNSSFSWWAAQLSYSNLPRVISPFPWFAEKSEPVALVPEHWARSARLQ